MRNVLLAFLCTLLLPVSAQVVKKTSFQEEFYENGNLKKITRTTIKRNRQFKLFGNFKITVLQVKEYHENGNVKMKQKRITKLGNTGKPCYETLNKVRTYNEHGRLLRYTKVNCDKRREVIKEYHPLRGVIFKQKTKRR